MDVVLKFADKNIFTPYAFPDSFPEDYWLRQFLSLNIISCVGGATIYFVFSILSFYFIFDKRLLRHPQMLKNQPWLEISYTCKSIPFMGFLSPIVFLLEVRGYSKLYDKVEDSTLGWFGVIASVIFFILFTDCFIYFIHRYLHAPIFYKTFHKPHHKWKVPTPFSSHAFHPIDGFVQSLPYHLYVFIFPMHKFVYLILYLFVNVWTVSIHDGNFQVPELLRSIINGSAHHSDHHLFYNYNYGQYFTLWDKICDTFKEPSAFEGNGPLEVIKRIDEKNGLTKYKNN